MPSYTPPTRDMAFVLHEVLKVAAADDDMHSTVTDAQPVRQGCFPAPVLSGMVQHRKSSVTLPRPIHKVFAFWVGYWTRKGIGANILLRHALSPIQTGVFRESRATHSASPVIIAAFLGFTSDHVFWPVPYCVL